MSTENSPAARKGKLFGLHLARCRRLGVTILSLRFYAGTQGVRHDCQNAKQWALDHFRIECEPGFCCDQPQITDPRLGLLLDAKAVQMKSRHAPPRVVVSSCRKTIVPPACLPGEDRQIISPSARLNKAGRPELNSRPTSFLRSQSDLAKRLAGEADFRGEDLQNLRIQRRFRLQQKVEVGLGNKSDIGALFDHDGQGVWLLPDHCCLFR